MSYALPRTSLGPACFRTLTALASEPRSWQLQALYVEYLELFDLFTKNKARSSFACRCRARRNICVCGLELELGHSQPSGPLRSDQEITVHYSYIL